VETIPSLRSSFDTQFLLLAPQGACIPKTFARIYRDEMSYRILLEELQRFRGDIYLKDGAIPPQALKADGRHASAIDEKSWHVLSLNESGTIGACLRFSEETHSAFENLWIGHATVARCPTWSGTLRQAIESQLRRAQTESVRFGEVGGWAVAEARRCTAEAIRIILATYGLLELMGGCIGVATATLRHRSAAILRRIGLWPLAIEDLIIPSYYDRYYDCQMEVLQFDSRQPNPRYRGWIAELSSVLKTTPVIGAEELRIPVTAEMRTCS